MRSVGSLIADSLRFRFRIRVHDHLPRGILGRKSVEARKKKWGRKAFVRKMREWGKLGGRPRKNSGKDKAK
jgi:hypothetical protein